jgi:hypothetical protein
MRTTWKQLLTEPYSLEEEPVGSPSFKISRMKCKDERYSQLNDKRNQELKWNQRTLNCSHFNLNSPLVLSDSVCL